MELDSSLASWPTSAAIARRRLGRADQDRLVQAAAGAYEVGQAPGPDLDRLQPGDRALLQPAGAEQPRRRDDGDARDEADRRNSGVEPTGRQGDDPADRVPEAAVPFGRREIRADQAAQEVVGGRSRPGRTRRAPRAEHDRDHATDDGDHGDRGEDGVAHRPSPIA